MTRRERREHIFRILFGVEFYPEGELEEQRTLYFEQVPDEEIPNPPALLSEEEKTDLKETVQKIIARIPELDEKLNEAAVGWTTARMGKADLAILRLALFEIKYDEQIPTGVAINEAVELAKQFGGKESPSFVNGVLSKFA